MEILNFFEAFYKFAFFKIHKMIRINQEIINNTISKAKLSPRQRMNFNFHPKLDDMLQRMLNAVEPGTYIQPHKHENPDKTEVFLILTGKILVVEFDDCGNIVDKELLDSTSGRWAAEIPPRTWHTIISMKYGSVAYEVKNGPYSPIDDKNFASWAPKEGQKEAENYLRYLTGKCGF